MKVIILLLLTLTCLFTTPANAQSDITQEGAAHLKAIFESMLRDQTKIREGLGRSTLEQQGEVIVEKAGKFYAVTLPHLQSRYKDGSRFEFGIISINAVPGDIEGQWKMTFAFPSPMRLVDQNGNETRRITLGGQQAAGIFHGDVRQFSKINAKFNSITIENAAPEFTVTLPETVIRLNLEQNDDGRWSGPGFIEINDLELKTSQIGKSANLKQAKIGLTFDRFDPLAGLTYQKRITALTDKGAFKNPDRLSEETTKDITSAVYDMIINGMNGLKSSLSIKNLNLTETSETQTNTLDIFKLSEAYLTYEIDGLLEDRASFAVNFGYDGLKDSLNPESTKDILPTNNTINLKIKNIPFTGLVQVVQNALGTNPDAETLKIASFGLLLKIPALLSNAGTVIEMNDNHIGNHAYRADFNAEVKADITAANSATARARGSFQGLDTLIKNLEALPAETAEDISILSLNHTRLLTTLKWIKSISKTDKTDSGKAFRVLDFIMNEKGKILLNGKDIKKLKKPNFQPPKLESTTPDPGDPTQPI